MYNVSLTEWHRQRFKPIFACIERACEEVGVEFYLVGAVARDISMAIHGMESSRVTRDLDVAVLVTDEAEYWTCNKTLDKFLSNLLKLPVIIVGRGKIV